ncbi:MAG TPA: hypothetical protein VIJ47_13200 [Acidimicrobiales bacterium]
MAAAQHEPRREPTVEPDGAGSGAVESSPPEPSAAAHLSWAEQEVLTALKRLARAQSNLQALEGQHGPAPRSFDPADADRLDALAADLRHARSKASGRFAKGAARERVEELEMNERLLLDRLGVASYDDYRAIVDAPPPAIEAADPAVLAFARQELASAQEAWLSVQAMEVPDEEPVEEPAEAPGAPEHPAPDVA